MRCDNMAASSELPAASVADVLRQSKRSLKPSADEDTSSDDQDFH